MSPIRGRLTPLPVASFLDRRLTATDYQTLGIVSATADVASGWCWRTQRELAALIHHAPETVSRALARLTRWDYLTVAHGLTDRARRRKLRTVYRLSLLSESSALPEDSD